MRFEDEKAVLFDIADTGGGVLTVDAVLEAARAEESPLHKHFEWDDTVAAEQHRRWQARVLIAKCRITIEPRTETSIRAFVSLPSDRAEGGYRVMAEVLSDADQRAELLQEMKTRVIYWQRQASLLDPATRQALDRFARELDPYTDSVSMAA